MTEDVGLPSWIKDPVLVSQSYEDLPSISSIPLDSVIKKNLLLNSIENFFPSIFTFILVQQLVIPSILKSRNRDICISVPTGSGKTLSFVVPIIQVTIFNFFN